MKRVLAAVVCVGAVVTGLCCGGTDGTDGLPQVAAQDASGGASSAAGETGYDGVPNADAGFDGDATLASDSPYTGLFDVFVPYADRVLPDVQPLPEADSIGTTSADFPSCPPDIAVDLAGVPTEGGFSDPNTAFEVYAEYDDAGSVVPAPDGSVCATYPWLGSEAVDDCALVATGGTFPTAPGPNSITFPIFPICNWARDTGTAAQGNAAGSPRYELCLALYSCFLRTECFVENYADCICGRGLGAQAQKCLANPQGACLVEELNALEAPALTTEVLGAAATASPVPSGIAGDVLNQLFVILDNPENNCSGLLLDAGADAP